MEQYEGPRRAELAEYADMMNGYPKYVVSATLEEPLEWNNSTFIEGNVAGEVLRLKQEPGKDILVFGSAALVNTLLELDLIDELRLMVFPAVLGGGKRLFGQERYAGAETRGHGDVRFWGRRTHLRAGGRARSRE
jgi:dihydrofolate reductase